MLKPSKKIRKRKGKSKVINKTGRPFKGNVKSKEGDEKHVPQKRSLFRKLKKFYGKGVYLKYKKGSVEKKIRDFTAK